MGEPKGRGDVKAYTIVVHDRRSGEPLRLATEMAHDARACEFARQRLASSPHITAVEVWCDELRLLVVSDTTRAAA